MRIIFVLLCLHFGNSSSELVEFLKDAVANSSESRTCIESMELYLDNLVNPSGLDDLWALKMFDATTKSLTGLVGSLNFGELGDFDQCLRAESKDGKIKARYCLGRISLSNLEMYYGKGNRSDHLLRQINLRNSASYTLLKNIKDATPSSGLFGGPSWAICLPSDCSNEEVNGLLRSLMIPIEFTCQTKEDLNPPLTIGATATIVVFSIIICIMFISTIYDLQCRSNNREALSQSLIAFSVLTNGENLLRVNRKSSGIACLNGIRFISMMWVVIGHVSYSHIFGPITNYLDLIEWAGHWHSMILVNATFSVDTFLVVGGALMVYGFLKNQHLGVRFNILQYYIHRYLRLTPALAAMVLVSSTILPYLGSGPIWGQVSSLQKPCSKNWWATLLYIQNYYDIGQQCIAQSWYLGLDMQLYFLSPLLFFPIWYLHKYGPYLVLSLIGASIVANFFIAFEGNLSAIITSPIINLNDYSSLYYLKTHTRLAPWLIGVLLGYYVYCRTYKGLKFPKLRKEAVIVLWIISIGTLVTCVFAGHSTLRGPEFDKWGNSFYLALVRPVWALCVAWVILACIEGHGGPINTILSLPIYQILNRFTYSIYIVHYTILDLRMFASKNGIRFSLLNMAFDFWGYLMFSFGLSIFWVLAFESPVIVLEKISTGPRKNK
ncbi:hypothetical protein JTB14_034806 [Gonioctena quinquepunctata]|nr:hypothetical protein JTB14_034806 [Gonioctena quinquepunctata]